MSQSEYLGPAQREIATSSVDLSPNLRKLEGDFPGLSKDDQDVITIFDRLGNLIAVVGEEKTVGYMEPGPIDYTIEATRIAVDKDVKPIHRKYYEATAIYPTEIKGVVEEARKRHADETPFEIAKGQLIRKDPQVHEALRQVQMRHGGVIVRLIT